MASVERSPAERRIRRAWRPVLAFVVAALVVHAVVRTGRFESAELWFYDRLGLLAAVDLGADRRVAVVTIDEPTVARLGWPLSDDRVAELVERILGMGARAVGLDLYRDQPHPPGTDRLGKLLAEDKRVVGVTFVADTRFDRVPAPRALDGTDRVGFADLPVDSDSVVRRGLLYRDDGPATATSLALQLARLYLAADGVAPVRDAAHPEWLRLGHTSYRPLEADDGGYARVDAQGYQYLLDYALRWPRFRLVRAADILDGKVDAALFRDCAVVVGVVAPSSKDYFPAPSGAAAWLGRRIVYGAELQAAATGQLLRQATGETVPIEALAPAGETAWLLAWCAIGAALGFRRGGPIASGFGLALGTAIAIAAGAIALRLGWWLPVAAPASGYALAFIAVAGQRLAAEHRQRRELRHMFARFVDPGLADLIWRQRDVFLAGGRPLPMRYQATVLVSDLAGFSAVSEAMDPAEVMEWVGGYMDRMTDLIIDRGGMVEKFAGDGLLAVFGGPTDPERDAAANSARRAARCALDMLLAVEAMNRAYEQRDWPPLRVRIGMHTGPVVSGAVGSARRSQYTVIGDTPNIAARLEAFEKDEARFGGAEGSCRILISGATAALLGDAFRMDKVAEAVLRGREEPVPIFRLRPLHAPPGAGR